jgi:hypothetical protein
MLIVPMILSVSSGCPHPARRASARATRSRDRGGRCDRRAFHPARQRGDDETSRCAQVSAMTCAPASLSRPSRPRHCPSARCARPCAPVPGHA